VASAVQPHSADFLRGGAPLDRALFSGPPHRLSTMPDEDDFDMNQPRSGGGGGVGLAAELAKASMPSSPLPPMGLMKQESLSPHMLRKSQDIDFETLPSTSGLGGLRATSDTTISSSSSAATAALGSLGTPPALSRHVSLSAVRMKDPSVRAPPAALSVDRRKDSASAVGGGNRIDGYGDLGRGGRNSQRGSNSSSLSVMPAEGGIAAAAGLGAGGKVASAAWAAVEAIVPPEAAASVAVRLDGLNFLDLLVRLFDNFDNITNCAISKGINAQLTVNSLKANHFLTSSRLSISLFSFRSCGWPAA